MYRSQTKCWNIERVIRMMAGSFILAGTALAATVSPWWLVLPALVGANLVVFSVSGFCPAAVILHKAGVTADSDC